jgi:salicylate hydroxylase
VTLRVAIVGGGIGGLSAALALGAKGIEVSVHEQASAISEVGAGVQIAPNGLRQLRRIGLGAELEGILTPFSEGSLYRRADGTAVADVVVTDSSGATPVGGVHRADLIDVLRSRLHDDAVHVGKRAVRVEQTEADATVTFTDGTTVTADVVVGADGIHSLVRSVVTEPSHPTFSGMVAYRGTVDAARLPDWPAGLFEVWMGPGRHFLTFPIRGGTAVNFVGFVPADDEMRESWSAPGSPTHLRAEFEGWDDRLLTLLDSVEATNRWGLYDREPLATWRRGRVCLLGDAAHAMLPHVGQGANQAIEDAVVLAEVLAQASPADAGEALAQYERARLPRTSAVQAGSRQNGLRYDSRYDDLGRRDAEMASIRTFRHWLYDHDALTDLRASTPASS